MTKEELIKHYQNLKDKAIADLDNFKSSGSTQDISKASRITESIYQYTCFVGSLKQLSVPVEDEWVSVEDRLPEPDQKVLLWLVHPDERLSRYIHWTWEKENTSAIRINNCKATHWRPEIGSPQPPSQTNKPQNE